MWHSREAARYPCAASSSPSSRRSVFHWTHVVGIPLVIFLFVLHTPQNGGWTLLVPTVVLGLEMAFRAAAACAPPLRITALVPLPGNACEVRQGVPSLRYHSHTSAGGIPSHRRNMSHNCALLLQVRLERPRWWTFLPGQYAWLRIPAVEAMGRAGGACPGNFH